MVHADPATKHALRGMHALVARAHLGRVRRMESSRVLRDMTKSGWGSLQSTSAGGLKSSADTASGCAEGRGRMCGEEETVMLGVAAVHASERLEVLG